MRTQVRTLGAILVGIVVTSVGAIGCGPEGADYSRVELIQVSGKVTIDGQPLVGAVVTFEAADGQFSYGLTDSNGAYALQFDSDKSGVTPGAKIVRISTARKIPGLNTSEGSEAGEASTESGPSAPAAAERVPDRFNSQSELRADVTRSQSFDFAIESK